MTRRRPEEIGQMPATHPRRGQPPGWAARLTRRARTVAVPTAQHAPGAQRAARMVDHRPGRLPLVPALVGRSLPVVAHDTDASGTRADSSHPVRTAPPPAGQTLTSTGPRCRRLGRVSARSDARTSAVHRVGRRTVPRTLLPPPHLPATALERPHAGIGAARHPGLLALQRAPRPRAAGGRAHPTRAPRGPRSPARVVACSRRSGTARRAPRCRRTPRPRRRGLDQSDPAEPGGVDDAPAAGQRHQLAAHRGVPAAAVGADLAAPAPSAPTRALTRLDLPTPDEPSSTTVPSVPAAARSLLDAQAAAGADQRRSPRRAPHRPARPRARRRRPPCRPWSAPASAGRRWPTRPRAAAPPWPCRVGHQPHHDGGDGGVGGEQLTLRALTGAGPQHAGAPRQHRLEGHPVVGPAAGSAPSHQWPARAAGRRQQHPAARRPARPGRSPCGSARSPGRGRRAPPGRGRRRGIVAARSAHSSSHPSADRVGSRSGAGGCMGHERGP